MHRKPFLAIAALLAAVPAIANDSEAEIGIGGIVLRPSAAVVMRSEDLFISEEAVRVAYRFHNPTESDITVTVAFPMPPQPRAMLDHMYDTPEKHDWSDFGFSTWVDGKPVRLEMIERAMIGSRDVTERIAGLGWPVYWTNGEGTSELFESMPEADRQRYIAEGLAVKDEAFGGQIVPAWDHVAFFVREQVFPANSTVEVRHEYVPVAGGSVGGLLEREVRSREPEFLDHYRKTYCVDDFFLGGIDRRLAERRKAGKAALYSETWLGYVLSSGANWKGKIGSFRLVVDKGSPDNLVSFCMDGARKIAPTRFEVTRTQFEPKRDLAILIVKFHEIAD